MSQNDIDVKSIVMFEFGNNLSASECFKKIKDHPAGFSVSLRTIQRYYKRLNEGFSNLNHRPIPGRPRSTKNSLVEDIIIEDPSLSLSEVAQRTGLSKSSVHRQLHRLDFENHFNEWVPHALTTAQFQRRCRISKRLRSRNCLAPFLRRIVTGDEKWLKYNNSGPRRFWGRRGTRIRLPLPEVHQKKRMLTLFWSHEGVVHFELLPKGESINAERYRQTLTMVRAKLPSLAPSTLRNGGPVLLHDNASSHNAKKSVEHAQQLGFDVLPHPPYSPDLAPTDYHVFRSLQHYIANKIFNSDEDLENVVADFIGSKSPEFWQRGIFSLPDRWDEVIAKKGDYI